MFPESSKSPIEQNKSPDSLACDSFTKVTTREATSLMAIFVGAHTRTLYFIFNRAKVVWPKILSFRSQGDPMSFTTELWLHLWPDRDAEIALFWDSLSSDNNFWYEAHPLKHQHQPENHNYHIPQPVFQHTFISYSTNFKISDFKLIKCITQLTKIVIRNCESVYLVSEWHKNVVFFKLVPT